MRNTSILIGVALNALLFSQKIAQLVFVDSVVDLEGKKRIYDVVGQIFFVSVNEFMAAFNFDEDVEHLQISAID